jgi:hypothetical protein
MFKQVAISWCYFTKGVELRITSFSETEYNETYSEKKT